MALLDWIRPKWKHSDPEVRLRAVQEIGIDRLDCLKAMVNQDPDTRVRLAALSRIDDERFLCEVASEQRDTPVGLQARRRLDGICFDRIQREGDAQVRLKLLRRLEEPDILARIACEIDDPDIRVAAARRIDNPEILCAITARNCGPKTGLAIVERISDVDLLRRIAGQASSKKVQKAAETRLAAFQPAAPAEVRSDSQKQRVSLLRELDALSHMSLTDETEKRLEELRLAWEALPEEPEADQERHFEDTREALAARHQRQKESRAVREALSELCRRVESVEPNADDVLPAIATHREAWAGLAGSLLPPSEYQSLEKRFHEACSRIEAAHHLMQTFSSDLRMP